MYFFSQQIPITNGEYLAGYILSKDGDLNHKKPVLWTHDRYHEIRLLSDFYPTEQQEDFHSQEVTKSNLLQEWVQILLSHGYLIVFVDIRGCGNSSGYHDGPFSKQETEDTRIIYNWLINQPWCNGHIGMFGRSYKGITQFFASTYNNLKIISPEMAMFDLYSFAYPGGIFRNNFAQNWGQRVKFLDQRIKTINHEKEIYKNARDEHCKNTDTYDFFFCLPYRDSQILETQEKPYITRSPSSYLKEINAAQIPTKIISGWYDIWTKDAFLWFANLHEKKTLIIGPWYHEALQGKNLAAYQVPWFEKYLCNNTLDDKEEGLICYYTEGDEPEKRWKKTNVWPLENQNLETYYFCNPNQTKNLGLLSKIKYEEDSNSKDDYIINYSTTTGKTTRWANGFGGLFNYPNLKTNDAKCLIYETAPLEKATEITGHPIVSIWLSSSVSDVDIFTYLENVDKEGYSEYITEGCLRASHRKIAEPPFNNLGLPYHISLSSDLQPLEPGIPAELLFDLNPISIIIPKGNKIRLSIACCDQDNALTMCKYPEPIISVHRSLKHASKIILPIIENEKT